MRPYDQTAAAARRVAAVLLLVGLILAVFRAGAEAADFNIIAPNVISLKGPIELEDCKRWEAALKPGIRYVMLSSNGGRVGQGGCISRSIYALRLKTVVLNKCSSICFLLFAAGAERSACPGARIGVHRPSDVKTAEEDTDPRILNVILDYAQRYGVPAAIRQKLSETPARAIYDLTPADLASMKVRACE